LAASPIDFWWMTTYHQMPAKVAAVMNERPQRGQEVEGEWPA
jgi:hypothetical protein